MAKPLARKIASGAYGRLEFDFACERGHAFGEYYLYGTLNEILASHVNPREMSVEAGFAHPGIQQNAGRGRRREVDFALVERAPEARALVCIEAKWAGSSHAKTANVLTDIGRLAFISTLDRSTNCLFVLAGGKDKVQRTLDSAVVTGQDGVARSLLPGLPTDGPQHIYPQTALSAPLLALLGEKVPRVPDRISLQLHKESHVDTPDWRVLVWKITG